ncbi:MAG: flagellar filament capping protein FliD [Gammaproteobacteria bacterium]|nr:flagellar filament capping protein FliD [Gammaproteobacteria bacterium]
MTIRSPGIASGIDINSLVSQLVAAERAPTKLRLDRVERRVETQLSAFGKLKGAMSALVASLAPLRSVAVFQLRKATSGDETLLTANATAQARTATYDIEVVQLASAHKLRTAAIAGGGGAVIGTGTLTITVGSRSFQLTIDGTNNTLAAIRDAINSAPDNAGVGATIVTTQAGAALVLTATASGAANTVQVTQSGGDGGLAVLTALTEIAPARDADVRIDGLTVNSASNTISGAIDGVTIDVRAAQPGRIVRLTVANDTAGVVDRVKKFVTDYNALALVVAQLRRYNPSTAEAGPLLGDALLRGIEGTVRGVVATAVPAGTSAYESLASVGVTTQADGTLKLDEAKLTAALTAQFDAVGQLFGAAQGIATRLHAYLDGQLKLDAPLSNRTDALNSQKRSIVRDRDALERRMQALEVRYRAQFSAMDRMLAGMQQTSAFLAQRLAVNPGA